MSVAPVEKIPANCVWCPWIKKYLRVVALGYFLCVEKSPTPRVSPSANSSQDCYVRPMVLLWSSLCLFFSAPFFQVSKAVVLMFVYNPFPTKKKKTKKNILKTTRHIRRRYQCAVNTHIIPQAMRYGPLSSPRPGAFLSRCFLARSSKDKIASARKYPPQLVNLGAKTFGFGT